MIDRPLLRIWQISRYFAPVLAIVLGTVTAEAGAGLGKSLLDAGNADKEEGTPTAPPPRGLPSMPKPPPEKLKEGPGLPPELQRQLRQIRALEERHRELEDQLALVSRPDRSADLAQVQEQIRDVEEKEIRRQTAFDADVERLAKTPLNDAKGETELRREISELEKRRADETNERAATLASLREQEKRLEAEIADGPILTPDERTAIQSALREQIKSTEDLRKRIEAGETVAFDPDTPPPPLPTTPAKKPAVDFSEDAAASADEKRARAEALRKEADTLLSNEAIDAELAAFRDTITKRGGNLEETQQLLESRRDSVEALRQLRADHLRDEAHELEDQAFLAEMKNNVPLPPGTRFQLRLTASADVHYETTNKQQSAIDIRYLPVTVTWSMRGFRWPAMGTVMDGKGGVQALESTARKQLEQAKAARGVSKYRIEYYEKALQVLGAMRRIGESAQLIRRDESVPPEAEFNGTTQVAWSAVEPSPDKDVPPTRIAARMRAAANKFANAAADWPESRVAAQFVLVQTTNEDQREIERLGADIEQIEFDLDDADREFKLQIGDAQDRMRNLIASISNNSSRATTAIGLSGGMYALTLDPRPFNWMPLNWMVTVTKTGGGRRAPETQSANAKGTSYPVQQAEETALGKLGIADLVANVKPYYLLLLTDEQIVNNQIDPERAFQAGVRLVPSGDRSRTVRSSLQSNGGIELQGEWVGTAHGKVALESQGTFSTSGSGGGSSTTIWEHEYTFTWSLRPFPS